MIDILQTLMLAILGWYAFRYVKVSRYMLYYVQDNSKVMGVTHSGRTELITEAEGNVGGIAANPSVNQPKSKCCLDEQ